MEDHHQMKWKDSGNSVPYLVRKKHFPLHNHVCRQILGWLCLLGLDSNYHQSPSYTGYRVIQTRTEIVEPIDSAIDLLSSRIESIKKELGQVPPNTKTLQIVLQGSIMLQVNVGPIGICKVFLSKASDYDAKKISKLRAVLEEFLKKCKFALAFNKSLLSEQPGGLDPQMQAHHNAMTEALEKVMVEATHYISLNQ
eukprot:TRINITY_DN1517_c0_g1_i4.p1 TRINITY_DN1517_c0_g1~~TRINITY_DN1517_c0_g1_i4.p1  ORF type:complete len:196 (-),score=36.72 TRINITY_DN1517_c0_g1_i4:310-897(-)